jgi:hypothetical protein
LDFQPVCMREACHIHLGKAMDTISVPGCSTVVSGHLAMKESEGDIMTYSARGHHPHVERDHSWALTD